MLAYCLPIKTLAETTSTIILCVFTVMHITLITIKLRKKFGIATIRFPIIFPIIGGLLTTSFLLVQFIL